MYEEAATAKALRKNTNLRQSEKIKYHPLQQWQKPFFPNFLIWDIQKKKSISTFHRQIFSTEKKTFSEYYLILFPRDN